MSGSVNKVILVGNLGRDPETRRMPSGDAVVNFSLATTESWKDKATGERKEKTEWHNIVIFNENLGRIAEQYLKKGSKVYVEGQLVTREYTDKEGQQRRVTEVVLQRFRGEMTLLDSRGRGGDTGADPGYASAPGGYAPSSGSYSSSSSGNASYGRSPPVEKRPAIAGEGRLGDTIDDDIPF